MLEYTYTQECFTENRDQGPSTFSSLSTYFASGALFLKQPYPYKRSENETFSVTITSMVYFLKVQMMVWSVLRSLNILSVSSTSPSTGSLQ